MLVKIDSGESRKSFCIWNLGLALFAALLVFFSATAAFGHRLSIFAYQEGKTLVVEGYFADGRPAAKSPVRLKDQKGRLLAVKLTDQNGIARFRLRKEISDSVTIELSASLGHRAEMVFHLNKAAGGRLDHGEEATASPPVHHPPADTEARDLIHAAAGSAAIALFFGLLYAFRRMRQKGPDAPSSLPS